MHTTKYHGLLEGIGINLCQNVFENRTPPPEIRNVTRSWKYGIKEAIL